MDFRSLLKMRYLKLVPQYENQNFTEVLYRTLLLRIQFESLFA